MTYSTSSDHTELYIDYYNGEKTFYFCLNLACIINYMYIYLIIYYTFIFIYYKDISTFFMQNILNEEMQFKVCSVEGTAQTQM